MVTGSNEVGGGSGKFVLKKWAAGDSTAACSRSLGDELEVVETDKDWMRAKATAASKGGWFSSGGGGYAAPAAPEAPAVRTRGPEVTIKVMHPEHKDHKIMTVEAYRDTTILELKKTICRETGLKEKPLIPAKKYDPGELDEERKAQMDQRLKDYNNWLPCDLAVDTVGSIGLANGDTFNFSYLSTAQEDLKDDLKWIPPVYSDSSEDESDHEWTYDKYVAQQNGGGGEKPNPAYGVQAGRGPGSGTDPDFME